VKFDFKLNGFDIFAVIIYLAVFTGISAALDNHIALVILGIPLIFIFPGYLLMLALYPRRKTLTLSERITLTVGLSLILLPSLGLLLNFTPFGITLFSILISVIIISILFGFTVWNQRREIPASEQFPPPVFLKGNILTGKDEADNSSIKQYRSLRLALIAVIVILLICILFMLALFATYERPAEKYTEFILLDADENMIDKPINLNANTTRQLTVIIENNEGETFDYQLRIRSLQFTGRWSLEDEDNINNDLTFDTDYIFYKDYSNDFTDTALLNESNSYSYNFTLRDGFEFRETFLFQIQNPGNYQLRFDLFTANDNADSAPYRWGYIIVLVT
jgi:uncharacterized membrane protein